MLNNAPGTPEDPPFFATTKKMGASASRSPPDPLAPPAPPDDTRAPDASARNRVPVVLRAHLDSVIGGLRVLWDAAMLIDLPVRVEHGGPPDAAVSYNTVGASLTIAVMPPDAAMATPDGVARALSRAATPLQRDAALTDLLHRAKVRDSDARDAVLAALAGHQLEQDRATRASAKGAVAKLLLLPARELGFGQLCEWVGTDDDLAAWLAPVLLAAMSHPRSVMRLRARAELAALDRELVAHGGRASTAMKTHIAFLRRDLRSGAFGHVAPPVDGVPGPVRGFAPTPETASDALDLSRDGFCRVVPVALRLTGNRDSKGPGRVVVLGTALGERARRLRGGIEREFGAWPVIEVAQRVVPGRRDADAVEQARLLVVVVVDGDNFALDAGDKEVVLWALHAGVRVRAVVVPHTISRGALPPALRDVAGPDYESVDVALRETVAWLRRAGCESPGESTLPPASLVTAIRQRLADNVARARVLVGYAAMAAEPRARRELYDAALSMLAAERPGSREQTALLSHVRLTLARAELGARRYEKALRFAGAVMAAPGSQHEWLQAAEARILAEHGLERFEAAMVTHEAFVEALRHVGADQSPRFRVLLKNNEAHLLLAMRRYADAMTSIDEAMERMTQLTAPVPMLRGCVYHTKGAALRASGRPGEARHYFELAVDIFSKAANEL